MKEQDRILGLLGLAARAHYVESGEFSTEKAIRQGRACLVLIAADSSENTKDKFHSMCEYHHVPCFEYSDKETLGHSIGKMFRALAAVTDKNFSDAIIRIIEQ